MAIKPEHAKFLKNMDKLEKILTAPKALGAAEVCKTYAKAKRYLEAVLPILEKIPGIAPIVVAIRLLMKIADAFCQIS